MPTRAEQSRRPLFPTRPIRSARAIWTSSIRSTQPGSLDGLERLVATTFTGYATDVGYATNGSVLSNGFVDGTIAPGGVDRPFANEVGFNFGTPNTVAPGTSSELLVIQTNSTMFTT